MEWFTDLLSPQVQEAAKAFFDLALLAAISYGADQLRRRRIIDLDRKMQDDLHRALSTGAKAILAGQDLKSITAEMREGFVQYVKDYAWRSSPDALGNIANGKPIPADVLDELARSKLNEVAMEMMKVGS